MNQNYRLIRLFFCLLIFLCAFLSSCRADKQQPQPTPQASPTLENKAASKPGKTSNMPVLRANSLVYLGAFRMPPDGEDECSMFGYSGEAMAFCASGNGGFGSLYVTGHNWYTYIAEITIPEPAVSKNVGDLPMADILQQFGDIRSGLFRRWTLEIPRVGLEISSDRLFFCWGEHMEETNVLGTHGVTGLNLSAPSAASVCRVDGNAYATNDYLFCIPPNWTSEYLQGFNMATGRFRDGGWSGMGPSLYAISTQAIQKSSMDEVIKAVPLIQYDDSYQGDTGAKMDSYSHADSWTGGAWITSEGGSAIVFAGTHGFGDTWYGFSNGVVWPTDGDENAAYPDVPDWPYDERGWWNSDFRACLVFYDPNDLTEVVSGSLSPNAVQPYAFCDLTEYMLKERDETDMRYIGGVAYDQTNRLFIQELFADGDRPVIHVFTFDSSKGQ